MDRAPTRLVSGAKAPRLPAPRSATEPTPIATPFSAVTVVPFPIATALFTLIVFLLPKEITPCRPSNVFSSPMTIVDLIFLALLLEPITVVF